MEYQDENLEREKLEGFARIRKMEIKERRRVEARTGTSTIDVYTDGVSVQLLESYAEVHEDECDIRWSKRTRLCDE